MNPHRTLWLAVIHQAMQDYLGGKLQGSYFASKDFAAICELASTDAAAIRERITELSPVRFTPFLVHSSSAAPLRAN